MRTLRTVAGFALIGAVLGACASTDHNTAQFGLDAPSIGAAAGAIIGMIGKLAQFF